jgi:hypothetical protein
MARVTQRYQERQWRLPRAPSPAISSHRERRCSSTSWPCTRWTGCYRGLQVKGEGEFLLLRAGAERNCTRSFCLGQDLCGDAAATVFHCVQLEPILQALGARGYRAAQLEGGVAAERLQLVAFALGFGATGLTFLDDVSAFFGTRAAPMLAVAVGVAAYGARPGKRPAQLPRISVAER